MPVLNRFYGDSLASLQPGVMLPSLTSLMHTPYDSGPQLDPINAYSASKVLENEEKTRFYLLQENSPSLTFQDALNNNSKGIDPVSCRQKQLRMPEFSVYLREGSKGIGDFPRS